MLFLGFCERTPPGTGGIRADQMSHSVMSDFPRPQLTPQQRAARTHRALCFDFSAVLPADAAHLAQAMADALDAATATGAAALPPRLKLIEQVVAGTNGADPCICIHSVIIKPLTPSHAILVQCARAHTQSRASRVRARPPGTSSCWPSSSCVCRSPCCARAPNT